MLAPSNYSYLNSFQIYGPLVKRLRHRPFTAVTRVRFPYGSLSWLLQLQLFYRHDTLERQLTVFLHLEV